MRRTREEEEALIIVGLGNFGDRYAYTYHNLGFLAVEAIADRLGFKWKKRDCDCLIASGFIGGEKIILAKPLTFMNLSGRAVFQLSKKYHAPPSRLLIIFDDVDIERGKLRIREEGSGGTHNGMKNVVEVMGRQDIPRIRIGVGPAPDMVPLSDYVLSDIPKPERQGFVDAFEKIIQHVLELRCTKK